MKIDIDIEKAKRAYVDSDVLTIKSNLNPSVRKKVKATLWAMEHSFKSITKISTLLLIPCIGLRLLVGMPLRDAVIRSALSVLFGSAAGLLLMFVLTYPKVKIALTEGAERHIQRLRNIKPNEIFSQKALFVSREQLEELEKVSDIVMSGATITGIAVKREYDAPKKDTCIIESIINNTHHGMDYQTKMQIWCSPEITRQVKKQLSIGQDNSESTTSPAEITEISDWVLNWDMDFGTYLSKEGEEFEPLKRPVKVAN